MASITVTVTGTTVVVGQNDKVFIDIPGGGDVTIVADPNDNVDKFQIQFGDDSESDSVTVDLSTFSETDLHIDIKQYDPSDQITLQGAFNKFVDPNDPDEFTFDYINAANGQTYSGFVHAKDGGEKDFLAPNPPIIICFGKGTEIETIDGPKTVESLKPGDYVLTHDTSIVPVRWVGSTSLSRSELKAWPSLCPIRVKQDALGAGRPSKDTLLSPNHRVLVSGWRAELLFGEPEILVPVKALVDGEAITVEDNCPEISYYHLLLESHQIIYSNGLLSESLFLGQQSLISLSNRAKTSMVSVLTEGELKELSSAPTIKPAIQVALAKLLAA